VEVADASFDAVFSFYAIDHETSVEEQLEGDHMVPYLWLLARRS
jgi:hypothetical protein